LPSQPLPPDIAPLLPPDYPLNKPVIVATGTDQWTDTFDDLIGYALRTENGWVGEVYPGTTDPGVGPRRGKSKIGVHTDGVARIDPGWYPDVYAFGWHKGRRDHPALVQVGDVAYRRYHNGAWKTPTRGVRGFNVHRAAWEASARVGDFSHGCLVFANRLDHWQFLLRVGYPEHGFPGEKETPLGGLLPLLLLRSA
jgi:hypothetical protein